MCYVEHRFIYMTKSGNMLNICIQIEICIKRRKNKYALTKILYVIKYIQMLMETKNNSLKSFKYKYMYIYKNMFLKLWCLVSNFEPKKMHENVM